MTNSGRVDCAGLLGREFVFQHRPVRVIELLDQGRVLVLEWRDGRQIQGNRHGEAHRRAPDYFHLPVYDDQGRLASSVAAWLATARP